MYIVDAFPSQTLFQVDIFTSILLTITLIKIINLTAYVVEITPSLEDPHENNCLVATCILCGEKGNVYVLSFPTIGPVFRYSFSIITCTYYNISFVDA